MPNNKLPFATTIASIALLSLFFSISCGPKPKGAELEKYLSYYSQAHEYMQQNEPLKAIPLYKKAIEKNYKFSPAYHEIAVCYQQVGNDSAAIANFEGAIVFNPRDVDAYQTIGNIYFMRKDYDKAQVWYEKGSEVDKLYPKTYQNMATIAYMRKDYEIAKKYFNLALAVDATYPRAYYGLGLIAFITGDTAEAESKFMDAVRVGSMSEAIYMLGTLYYDQFKYDQAEMWFNRYLEQEPNGEWAEKTRNMLLILKQNKSEQQ
jgi:tetratricopeptide (TPR) repeat protein